MKNKMNEVCYEGTQPVYGKAARRLERLINNPKKASAEEKENGYDIADYLIKEKSGEAILQSMCQKNPSLKKMIALLNLELVDFHFESK
jgi:hypothetical protein